MTKYKTNAQKLKFFNDAKAARMPKAMFGRAVTPPQPIEKGDWEKSDFRYEPRGPEDRLDPITGNIRPKSFPKKPFSSIRPKDPTKKYKEVTPEDVDFMLDPPTPQNPMDYMKKGGSTKRKKRK